ncbi:MAG: TonB family protein [Tannerella sp.]|nr:TonB family protein [Tannerella sp.]
MEIKKSQRANLEKSKSVNFMIGMIVALAVLFTGFEWGERYLNLNTNYVPDPFTDIVDVIDPTRQDPPEPPTPEIIKTPDILTIVENEKEVEPAQIAPTEDFKDMAQPVYTPPVEEKTEEPTDDYIHVNAEIMPEFPGGNTALLKWIAENVNYPTIAAENGVEGLVACSFVINTDGSISNVEVLRSKDPLLDKEAIRVLKTMPKWKPGMQQGKAVRVKFSVPVRFRLQK